MINVHLSILLLLIIGCLACIAWRRSLAFEYPYFLAAVFAIFILPQAYSLIRYKGGVGEDDVANVLLMSWLCLLAGIAGYMFKPRRSLVHWLSRPADENRVMHIGAVLVSIGVASGILIYWVTADYAEGNDGHGLTGRATILLFFSGLTFPGFAIFMSLLWRKITVERLIWTVVSSYIPIASIFAGRREPAAIFAFILVLTVFFAKRKSPHPVLIYAVMLFAMLAIPMTGTYRGLHAQGAYSQISKLDLVKNFKDFVGKESILELRNAAAIIKATNLQGSHGWGTAYWDNMVFRFVPAQFVGKNVKASLMFVGSSSQLYATKLTTNYNIPPGSTITGMGDSFEQFGWLGCLFFALMGNIFRSIWTAALKPQAIFAQLFYMMICSSAMRAVTHQTVDFFPGVAYQLIFLIAIDWYAGLPSSQEVANANPIGRPLRGSKPVSAPRSGQRGNRQPSPQGDTSIKG